MPPYDGLQGAKGGKITLFINNWTSVEDISNYQHSTGFFMQIFPFVWASVEHHLALTV